MAAPLFRSVCALLDGFVGRELTPEVGAAIARGFMDMVLGAPIDMTGLAPVVTGSYVLQHEWMRDVYRELRPLHEAHWHETEDYRHGLAFNPNYEWAFQAESEGRYVLLTARVQETGELVGNYALVLGRSHHTQTMVATEDTMFIVPEHRKGRLFPRFAQYGEAAARHCGAKELFLTAKLANQVARMLPRMGYRHVANQFQKLL